jgi:hypothetical protein
MKKKMWGQVLESLKDILRFKIISYIDTGDKALNTYCQSFAIGILSLLFSIQFYKYIADLLSDIIGFDIYDYKNVKYVNENMDKWVKYSNHTMNLDGDTEKLIYLYLIDNKFISSINKSIFQYHHLNS